MYAGKYKDICSEFYTSLMTILRTFSSKADDTSFITSGSSVHSSIQQKLLRLSAILAHFSQRIWSDSEFVYSMHPSIVGTPKFFLSDALHFECGVMKRKPVGSDDGIPLDARSAVEFSLKLK